MDDSLSGLHLLVVEDEPLIMMMIEDMLADLGCSLISSATTVAQAVALNDAHRFDAALLDLNLYGVTSYPVARALDARGVPFAFSSGNSVWDLDEMYREREFLRKPYRRRDLSKVLERLLRDRVS